jgi:ribose 5-phosphate isomerase B
MYFPMRIAIAADHAGFALKQDLRDSLMKQGHQVVDFGADNTESTDYPDYASSVAREVASGRADRGILVCSTGVGMSIAANKVRGVRAALATHPDQVRFTRAHNDANVLAIGANFTPGDVAHQMLDVFLGTEFEGGRHARRVAKITQLEQEAGE